jgi:hypothetical protein
MMWSGWKSYGAVGVECARFSWYISVSDKRGMLAQRGYRYRDSIVVFGRQRRRNE